MPFIVLLGIVLLGVGNGTVCKGIDIAHSDKLPLTRKVWRCSELNNSWSEACGVTDLTGPEIVSETMNIGEIQP